MLCRDCKHLKSKRVGYVSRVFYCGIVGDRQNGIGIDPGYMKVHPRCPLKNKSNQGRDKYMAIDNNSTKVITGKVRLSYVHVFEPQQDDQGNDKYSTAILIPKTDKDTLRKIKAAVDAAVELGKSKWNGKIPPNLKKPLRDGDEERSDEEAYAGHYFLNATSKNKPGIAKPIGKGADGKTKFQEITDTTEVYSGCYAKVSINFYPFDAKGNRGVAAGLNNIVKVQDGDFLGGRASVQDDFADEDFDEDIYEDDDDDFLS